MSFQNFYEVCNFSIRCHINSKTSVKRQVCIWTGFCSEPILNTFHCIAFCTPHVTAQRCAVYSFRIILMVQGPKNPLAVFVFLFIFI